MTSEVRDNAARQRYELAEADGLVFCDYVRQGNKLLINHTETPPALQGRGLASKLIRGVIADVRQRGLKIVPLCSFVADYFARHAEDGDVLVE